MSSDNPTADRLLDDARKKTAARQSPVLAGIAIAIAIVGAVCLVVLGDATQAASTGWSTGAIAVALGAASIKRDAAVKLAKAALVLGVLVILVATSSSPTPRRTTDPLPGTGRPAEPAARFGAVDDLPIWRTPARGRVRDHATRRC